MSQQTVVLDIRAQIRAGEAPCSTILETAGRLNEGDTLQVVAPFEPTPLYEVLGREGFAHESRELGAGEWEVRFTRDASTTATQMSVSTAPSNHAGGGCGCGRNEVIEIDVRGLEPPQPMLRILEAVAALPKGATLRAFTDRKPVHLFDQLSIRGYHGEGFENGKTGYVTVIRPH
jgi:uncharacterized protein (DUF2249 family)